MAEVTPYDVLTEKYNSLLKTRLDSEKNAIDNRVQEVTISRILDGFNYALSIETKEGLELMMAGAAQLHDKLTEKYNNLKF